MFCLGGRNACETMEMISSICFTWRSDVLLFTCQAVFAGSDSRPDVREPLDGRNALLFRLKGSVIIGTLTSNRGMLSTDISVLEYS